MKKLGSIHRRLLDIIKAHPDGIDITAIRRLLALSGTEQQHLDRRIRDLRLYYSVPVERREGKAVYVFRGLREAPASDAAVDQTTRARILHLAGYRCQMCGRSPERDGVRLQVDHRIPRDWGGSSEDENLWAVCEECNAGKKNFFASITDRRVREAILHESIHVRIGELLKAFAGEPVPKEYIQIVAYTHDDFEKRMRELRELGWSYRFTKRKEGRRVRTYFVLEHWEEWPPDPAAEIRRREAMRGGRRTQAP